MGTSLSHNRKNRRVKLPGQYGRSLTYLRGVDVMSVAIAGGVAGGAPVKLFSIEADDLLLDVMRDGRLIVLRRTAPDAVTSLNLIVNWFGEVRRRAGR